MFADDAIRVVLAGSEDTVMERLTRELDEAEGIAVCAAVAGGEEALAAVGAFSPDFIVILADSLTPGPDCLETARSISEDSPDVSVILVAECPMYYLISAVKYGVTGLLPVQMAEGELVTLVRKVHVWAARPMALV